MAMALIVLAIGSVLAGYIGVPHALGGHNQLGTFLEQSFAPRTGAVPSGIATMGDCAAEPVPTTQVTRTLTLSIEGAPGATIGDCAPGQVPANHDAVAAGHTSPVKTAPQMRLAQAEGHGEAAEDVTTLELTLMAVSSLIAIVGIGLAAYLYLQRPEVSARIASQFPGLHRLLLNKYYVDELYDATVVQPIRVVSQEGLWRGFDVRVIDGAVNGAGYVVGGLSALLRLLQSGSVKAYAASTFLGVVLILAYYIWR
jgi:hypothetical protein